uniref:putative peptidyl-tRNA hydrolase PTRHD1 n=1 Tax=Myxine glutinosa TaxID=7769 RepID=UPI0035900C08
MANHLVQYVVLRSDLQKVMGWPLGAVVAQGCHACSAALHMFRADAHTQRYLADVERMHKVVLAADGEDALRELTERLLADGIDHHLWVEQPENIATGLALKPYPKEEVHHLLKQFKLLK